MYKCLWVFRHCNTCNQYVKYLYIYKYIIYEKERSHEFERVKRGMWEDFDGGEGRRKLCNNSIISKLNN